MGARTNEDVVLDALDAVELRDRDRLAKLYHADIEFNWPAALPYGGRHRGAAVAQMTDQFARIWIPLQPTELERRMEPTIVASQGDNVIARYIWKGRDKAGRDFATDTLAHYRVREQKLIYAQMYHFDLTGLVAFLAAAKT
jgi:ketosteroid isomerase-like protein